MRHMSETETEQANNDVDQVIQERRARAANAADLWDDIWKREGAAGWRREALHRVHTRIVRQIPEGARVLDLGGGVGDLAFRLAAERSCHVTVWDKSRHACEEAERQGDGMRALSDGSITARVVDLDDDPSGWPLVPCGPRGEPVWVVMTETLEHLGLATRRKLIEYAHAVADATGGAFLCSVPNNRLGPDEEPQHAVKFTAVALARELRHSFRDVRVSALGPYLLAFAGPPARRQHLIAVTLPVRDEAHDLEATLASFREVADLVIVGVDPRTVDATREVAACYADVVFDLVEPEGPPDERVPAGGVHFAHMRNQCLQRVDQAMRVLAIAQHVRAHDCWVFMTEGHERLRSGASTLHELANVIPASADVVYVMRSGANQRWAFPWLHRLFKGIRYTRPTHNRLDYPEGTECVTCPAVVTLHERHDDNARQRAGQRTIQNRATLLDDWERAGNLQSLFYLGQELRSCEPDEAARYLATFLDTPANTPALNGPARYQARLMLARLHVRAGKSADARRVLIDACQDDWSRTEHLLWLGDLAFRAGQHEEALQFYRYAGTSVGEPPATVWWIDLACYSYLPAQRLAMTFGHLGRGEDALAWARQVVDLLPDDAPPPAFEEALGVVRQLREALAEHERAGV